MFSKRHMCALFLTLIAATTPVWADDDDEKSPIPAPENQGLLVSQLVRVAEVNVLSPNPALGLFGLPVGVDPLSEGQAMIRRDRKVTFQVRGAATGIIYVALFCRFGFAFNPGCMSLGQFSTDSSGAAASTLDFPTGIPGTDAWTGQFILTRNGAAQFVSGFKFPPPAPATAPANGVEFHVSGQILSINVVLRSFQLAGLPLPIFTDNSTKFDGHDVDVLTDLKVGDEVQVTGFSRSDSTIYATHVVRPNGKNNNEGRGGDH